MGCCNGHKHKKRGHGHHGRGHNPHRNHRRLNQLENGQEGKIIALDSNQDIELKRHLLGMGFVKGANIKLEKVAPLGDPIKFQIKGYSVCLRKDEAKNIEVELIEENSNGIY